MAWGLVPVPLYPSVDGGEMLRRAELPLRTLFEHSPGPSGLCNHARN
eukprot:CAMPEP_0204154932 /NCGR_PEP_ID=MMETSP0361-20130328/29156_1 /ASSEMBLY_ACC=CAM_ASM_000343 /TAXON_ID=268821 /ORGANISM="Scrippsiella Hangoei, Strain SHTV-5" /LENGTH=46 /DNA_ID= /DNA_START= /DNA_END= /DNA_ORIENTATION=